MIRVITADDHALIRQGLRRVLEKTQDIRVVAEAQDGKELLATLREHPCDVLLLDISMPGPDVMEILHRVLRDFPLIKVLILSMHPEDQQAVRLFKAGALGYVHKSQGLNDLVTAVRRVAAGRRYISERLAERLAEELADGKESAPHHTLSGREYQIFLMLAQGKSNKEIAAELHLSPKTISTYRARILEKMGFANNAQMTYYAIQNRLI